MADEPRRQRKGAGLNRTPPSSLRYKTGRMIHDVGQEVGSWPSRGMRALEQTLGGLQVEAENAVRPFVAGLAGVDPSTNESLPEIMPRPPASPSRLPSTDLKPGLSNYRDPAALPTLAAAAPEPPPQPVAGHLRPGQMVVSGTMRRYPERRGYSDEYLQSLNPESFAAIMGRDKAIAEVRQQQAAAREPAEMAAIAGAAQDEQDFDTQYRAPGRQAGLLRLKQLEFQHPASQMAREEAQRQAFLRYGLPQQIAGEYDLSRQGLVNQGLLERTGVEQSGLNAREQFKDSGETERQRIRTAGDTRSAAMRALGSMETKRMDPYAPKPYESPYEADFYTTAFPQPGGGPVQTGAAAGMETDSPEQTGEIIKRQWPGLDAAGYQRVLAYLEQTGHVSGLTDLDRQRIYSVLGVR